MWLKRGYFKVYSDIIFQTTHIHMCIYIKYKHLIHIKHRKLLVVHMSKSNSNRVIGRPGMMVKVIYDTNPL